MKEEDCLVYEDHEEENIGRDYPPKPVIIKSQEIKNALCIPKVVEIIKNNFYISRRRVVDFKNLLEQLNNFFAREIKLEQNTDGIECYRRYDNTISLRFRENGKGSLITFLHEFQHALAGNEWLAVAWSLTIFKDCYPKSFAKLEADNHCLRQSQ